MSKLREFGTKDLQGAVDNYVTEFEEGDLVGNKEKTEGFVNKYYDIATSFYEHGWGPCFHFATQTRDETFREAIRRHEYYLAMKLALKKDMKVLDVGCGIGGPAVNIARFSEAHVNGININKYQIKRGNENAAENALTDKLTFTEGSFLEMPFPEASFNAAYSIEATCHSPDQNKVYSEVFRVLKPGSLFAMYEWCLTDKFDFNNADHLEIKRLIEIGDALPDIRTVKKTLEVVKDVGFEILETEDRGETTAINDVPWYRIIDQGFINMKNFKTSELGVKSTHVLVNVMETFRMAPKGTAKCHKTLRYALKGLKAGGREGIFTPALFVLARKPEN